MMRLDKLNKGDFMSDGKPKVYTKRPISIEALEWTGVNHTEMYDFIEMDHFILDGEMMIKTLEGEHKASIGDFIIKGVKGEFYPCKPDIFHLTYCEGDSDTWGITLTRKVDSKT